MSWLLKFLVSLSISTSLLTGTDPVQSKPPQPSLLVVAVRVTQDHNDLYYEKPQQVEAILAYLRSLTPTRQAQEDPERYLGPSYTLTLYCHRGGTRVYRLKSHRWMSKNNQPWRRIPQEKAQRLPELLRSLTRSSSRGAGMAQP